MSQMRSFKKLILASKLLLVVLYFPFILSAQSSSISPDSIAIYPQLISGAAFKIITPSLMNTSTAVTSIRHNGLSGITMNLYKSNLSNSADVLSSVNNGSNGHAGFFRVSNPMSFGTAITAVSVGQERVMFLNQVGEGEGARFQIDNTGNDEIVFRASTNGKGSVGDFRIGNSTSTADVLYLSTSGNGHSLNAVTSSVAGLGAKFTFTHPNNQKDVLTGSTVGKGNVMKLNYAGGGMSDAVSKNIAIFQNNAANVARIDNTGKGCFNGGTQNSGADLAEAFEVEGLKSQYESGDVLIISTKTDRTITKSNGSYSNLIAGVYATKPGVLLTEAHIDNNLENQVPMGVVGVIPTKVCNENGKIQRGDMLVSSSKVGYAMKADLDKVKIGQVLGKALENFSGENGLIKVLVNVK